MEKKTPKVRLYIDTDLSTSAAIELSKRQYNYLFNVMRLRPGDFVFLIDGKTGEYISEITKRETRSGSLNIISKNRDLNLPLDLWLLFSPIKKNRTDFIIEKATELGIKQIIPIVCTRTNSHNFRTRRMRSIMIEALEQCGGTFLPKVQEINSLKRVLLKWPRQRQLIFCDELISGPLIKEELEKSRNRCGAILIGPEGGFTDDERLFILSVRQSISVSMGSRILRAETAALSAISIWQSVHTS